MLDKFLQMLIKQYRSSDFDSDHPLCMWLIDTYGLDYEQGVWLSILTMAFYNEASAWIAFHSSDPFTVPKEFNLPIDKNRRNLYGAKIVRHLDSVCTLHREYPDWPCQDFTGDPARDWFRLKHNLGQAWGNGRFAVYNTADMLHKVNGVQVTVEDFENKSSSGPADAIWRISNCDRKNVEQLDREGEAIHQRVLASRRHPIYTKSDRGTIESVLCNFSGMCRGKYYPGRNIDRQQGRIIRLQAVNDRYKKLLEPFWTARQACYLKQHLGEFNGWEGVDRPRMKHYAQTGEMLCPEDKR